MQFLIQNQMEYLNYTGLALCCPKCGWEPKSKLFYMLSLSVYLNKNKLHDIHCKNCSFEGTLISYVTFYRDFYQWGVLKIAFSSLNFKIKTLTYSMYAQFLFRFHIGTNFQNSPSVLINQFLFAYKNVTTNGFQPDIGTTDLLN